MIALRPAPAALRGRWAGQEGNRAPPGVQQMLCGTPRAGLVVNAHRSQVTAGRFTVDEDDGREPGEHCAERLVRKARAAQDDAIHPLRFQRAQRLDLAGGIFHRVAEQQTETRPVCRVLSAARNFREEWVGDVGHDQPQRGGLLGHQAAGEGVGAVAEAVDGFQDARARLGADLALVVERARHRLCRHACLTSNIRDVHPFAHHRINLLLRPGRCGPLAFTAAFTEGSVRLYCANTGTSKSCSDGGVVQGFAHLAAAGRSAQILRHLRFRFVRPLRPTADDADRRRSGGWWELR